MPTYIAGNIIETQANFTADDNTTPIDPTSITVRYTVTSAAISGPFTISYTGSSTPATNTVYKTTSGTYRARLDTSLLPGYWVIEWVGVGSGQAVTPISATVYPAPI